MGSSGRGGSNRRRRRARVSQRPRAAVQSGIPCRLVCLPFRGVGCVSLGRFRGRRFLVFGSWWASWLATVCIVIGRSKRENSPVSSLTERPEGQKCADDNRLGWQLVQHQALEVDDNHHERKRNPYTPEDITGENGSQGILGIR